MAEIFTLEIAREYARRAAALPYNGLQDIGERRALRIELQDRFDLTEMQALNVVNGYFVSDVVHEWEYRERMKKMEA